MIKTILFDFGDVFINLDKSATQREFSKLGYTKLSAETNNINILYEMGKITTPDFINHYITILPNASEKQIIDAWNAILIDFPRYRLDYIQQLASKKKYKLLLLSNTNELHINWIKENISFYEEFKSCFDSFYLSQEINLRKPNTDIFKFVLDQHQLIPQETLFIDDTTVNTNTASEIGMQIWNNNPKTEDIIDLFTLKSNLF